MFGYSTLQPNRNPNLPLSQTSQHPDFTKITCKQASFSTRPVTPHHSFSIPTLVWTIQTIQTVYFRTQNSVNQTIPSCRSLPMPARLISRRKCYFKYVFQTGRGIAHLLHSLRLQSCLHHLTSVACTNHSITFTNVNLHPMHGSSHQSQHGKHGRWISGNCNSEVTLESRLKMR